MVGRAAAVGSDFHRTVASFCKKEERAPCTFTSSVHARYGRTLTDLDGMVWQAATILVHVDVIDKENLISWSSSAVLTSTSHWSGHYLL
jgi:hypothetical protein